LIVGTIAERVFRDDHLAALEPEGFEIEDLHEAGENRDYALRKGGLELPINVKVASTLFRNAQQVVGLAPEDCIPISAYKAIGASERVPDLVYVDLVDFELRERVDDYMDGLAGSLGIGWHLLSRYGGPGVRAAEDQYLRSLFDEKESELKALAPGATSYRVISAKRVIASCVRIRAGCPASASRVRGRGRCELRAWRGARRRPAPAASRDRCDRRRVPARVDGTGAHGPRPDVSGQSLRPFVESAVAPGSRVLTGGGPSHGLLPEFGYAHTPTSLRASGDPARVVMPRVHRLSSPVERWLLGTHQGAVGREHLDDYLNESTFRFNRRSARHRGRLFYRLLEQAAATEPVPYSALITANG
jgi:ISXO2-like transposase domain